MRNIVLERWLLKQTLSESFLNLPVGAICLLASLIALAFTGAIAWGIGWILLLMIPAHWIYSTVFGINGSIFFCGAFSGIVLLLLFVSHYVRNAEYLRYAKFHSARVHVSEGGIARALNVLLSRPSSADSLFQSFFYAGPRWFFSAVSMFYKSVTLLQTDIRSCTKILLILFKKGSRVTFTELAEKAPEINGVKVFPQLRDIAGVIFLQREPSGISLTSDLRAELARVLGVKIEPQVMPHFQDEARFRQRTKAKPSPPPPPPIVEEEPPGPHKVLGVSRNASLREIKAAYRKQIKQCHPDRFATLNKDWQQMADQRTKAVIEAYSLLSAKFSSRRK